ncbi:MAG: AAA family ATPase, partial [Ferruginibacter sp.]|nr:AAA family ATPase [Cytophagales bacterium]
MKPLPNHPPTPALDGLLARCPNLKHRTILLLLADAGLGVSACVALRFSDFDFRNRTLTIHSTAKDGTPRPKGYPISDRLYGALADYLATFPHPPGKQDYLFPGTEGRAHLSRKAVNRFIDLLEEKHPDLGKVSPTSFRRAAQPAPQGTSSQGGISPSPAQKTSFWQATLAGVRKRFSPTRRPRLISPFPTEPDCSIGREGEIARINQLVDKHCNVILMGPIGIGKSHLLQRVRPQAKVLRFDDVGDIKRTLIQTLLYLYQNDKAAVFELVYGNYELTKLATHLQRDSVRNLCAEMIRITQRFEYLLLIDSVDRITPRSVNALEYLKDHFTILTSAREVVLNKGSFLWNFQVIRIGELSRQHSLELIHHLSGHQQAGGMDIEDYALFRNHLYEQSNGNPRVICELIDRYRKERVVTNEVVKEIRHVG